LIHSGFPIRIIYFIPVVGVCLLYWI